MIAETIAAGFPQPLAGKAILDLSLLFPGPYCTAQLAAFGARIIKVEPPQQGDPMRALSPQMFEQINRNKESVVINLKRAEGRDLLKRMVADADALVEGFRPDVMGRLGLGYESLRELNPALVYCAISGFGQDGPYRDKPGHDLGFLALGGYFSVPSQINDAKTRPNVRLADAVAGQFAAHATSMAIWEAQTSGRGRIVDASIFDGVASLALPMIFAAAGLGSGDVQQMQHVMADSDLYETQDGRYLALSTLEDKLWHGFVAAACEHNPELADERFSTRNGRDLHKLQLRDLLAKAFKTKTLALWREILHEANTACAPVYERYELLSDPHFRARRVMAGLRGGSADDDLPRYSLYPVKFNGVRETIHRAAPPLGADTDTVLQALGCSHTDIDELRRKAVVQ